MKIGKYHAYLSVCYFELGQIDKSVKHYEIAKKIIPNDYNIIHLDCYREKDINRWLNIGLIDYFNNENILFIEWAEKIKNILPDKTKNLFFEVIGSNERMIKYYE